MWLFIAGAMLGGFIGVGYMCLIQINVHSEIMKGNDEEK